jgi:hypothetical protein
MLLGKYDVQLSIAWWDYRTMVQIHIDKEELESTKLST